MGRFFLRRRAESAVLTQTLDDALSVADDALRRVVSPRTLSDTLDVDDALDRARLGVRWTADAVTADDALLRQAWIERTLEDSVDPIDDLLVSLPGLILRTLTDGLQTDDALGRAVALVRQLDESIAPSDALGRAVASVRDLLDALESADALADAAVVRGRVVSDSLGASDSVLVSLLGTVARTLSDSLDVTDQTTRHVVRMRLLTDALNTADGLGDIPTIGRPVALIEMRCDALNIVFEIAPLNVEVEV